MIRAIFFDVDDTLIDHSTAMGAAIDDLHTELHLEEPIEQFRIRWKASHRRHYPRFLRGEISYKTASRNRVREAIDPSANDNQADRLFEFYLARYEAGWRPFPDVLPCLDSLGTFRLGVISNGRTDEQKRKLTTLGVAGRFQHVLISEEVGMPKPDRELFILAAKTSGVMPSEILYVGDQYHIDACAARDAGMYGVWLDRHKKSTKEHAGPIINSLGELVQISELVTDEP